MCLDSEGLEGKIRRRTGRADHLFPNLCHGEGLLGVVVTAELLSLLIVVVKNGIDHFSWLDLGMTSMMALWVSLLSASALCLTRNSLARFSHPVTALVSYTLILAITALTSIAGQWLMSQLETDVAGFGVNAWALLNHLIIAAIPAGILLRHLYLQQMLRVQQRAELESRIQAMQSRIRPHFLFNSMNIIASLIGSDPEKAETVVEDLSDLFRHALTDNHTLVPLQDELNLCRRYLAIERLRLGDRLNTVWQIGDYGDGVQIPSLSLQPVIENAVYHGIQLLPEGGEISVTVNRVGDRINIDVKNPRNPRMQHNKGNKMAVANVLTRLQAHFGSSANIQAEVQETCYITHINYPVRP
jgi:two-component system, LytTR family, sensor histidine kinase AlgZ